jgi:hypothetical protein
MQSGLLPAWTEAKSGRLTGFRDFHEGAAQLDCEPAKQVATLCQVTDGISQQAELRFVGLLGRKQL